MPFGGHLQRRRPRWLSRRWRLGALAVAVGGVVTYAVQADGYQSHQAELNDGGIWVTSNRDGSYGRINKPIGELDGTIFSRRTPTSTSSRTARRSSASTCPTGLVIPLDPPRCGRPTARRPRSRATPAVGMAGGSLAVLDTATGGLWATRDDPAARSPGRLDARRPERAAGHQVGKDAALAVALDGTVFAASAAEDRLLTLRQEGETAFADARRPRTCPVTRVSDAVGAHGGRRGARSCSTPRPAGCSSIGGRRGRGAAAARCCSSRGPASSAVLVASRATPCSRSTWPPAR